MKAVGVLGPYGRATITQENGQVVVIVDGQKEFTPPDAKAALALAKCWAFVKPQRMGM